MGSSYHCTNINCSFPGENQFKMKFNLESIMDTNNFATIFCPFCKKPMVTSESLAGLKGSDVDTEEIHLSS